jgi:hypothetical protein
LVTAKPSVAFYKTCKDILIPLGIKFIAEETWAVGTLTDATPIMQKVKSLDPDLIVYMGDAISELQMNMMKKKEMGIKTPFLCGGAWIGDTSLKFAGEYLDSWIAVTSSFPHKLTPPEWVTRSIEQCRKEYSDEPWMAQNSACWMMVLYGKAGCHRETVRDMEAARKLISAVGNKAYGGARDGSMKLTGSREVHKAFTISRRGRPSLLVDKSCFG